MALDIIKLLPDNIANQIAAGEVIQRPASAVKELIENAIDAKASKIQLIIKDAGKTLIQVIDDGIGMSPTDARMSFERHATSKITNADDLFKINTKGFRGEALASIAAIAHVELKTKRASDETATLIAIEGAEVVKQEVCQSADGTNFSIKNLFFNVPARRTFLKSNPVELKHIIAEFTRIALAHPKIAFTFHNNGIEIFHLTKGSLKQRIVQLIQSKNIENKIAPIFEETDFLSIEGFIGKPEFSKKTRGEQYFFVNNRFIKSAYLNHAVVNAYNQLISKESYPFYVIFINIDPKRIDVNVHPTKQEIKFEDEKVVYQFINSGVRHSLGKFSSAPTIDFDQNATFNKHPFSSEKSLESLSSTFSGGSFIDQQSNVGSGKASNYKPKHSGEVKGWEDLYKIAQDVEQSQNANESQTVTVKSKLNFSEDKSNDLLLFDNQTVEPKQIHKKYILTQIKSGIMLIDQRAAHVRILYEKFIQMLAENKIAIQQSMFPKQINLNAADAQIFKSIINDVNALGFDIKEFGENDFVVHGTPSDLKNINEQELIEAFIEETKQSQKTEGGNIKTKMAKTLAIHSAIKAGNILDKKEMQTIIDELFACEIPYISPTGTLCFITFGLNDLEAEFKNANK